MNVLRLILVFTFVLAAVMSCKKKEITYEFEGILTNSKTGSAISNADIEVRQQIVGTNSASLNHTLAASDITDSEGNYNVIFEREKVTEFKFVLEATGYFYNEYFETSQDVNVGEPNKRDFILEPKGFVRFILKNVGTVEASDELAIFGFNFREDCNACYVNGYNRYYGAVDTTFTVSTTSNQYVRFFYQDVGTGSTTNDSLFVPFNDTIEYSINF